MLNLTKLFIFVIYETCHTNFQTNINSYLMDLTL